jgi:DNA-binding CsgD family transcriptional regulator
MLKRYSRYYILLLFFISPLLSIGFTIKGTFKGVSSCYYPKVYLAALNKTQHFNSVSSDFVIAEANINEDGSFSIKGDFLPQEQRFYRIYVTKEEDNNAYLSMGMNENYTLLVLDNSSNVSINCFNICEPYPRFKILGPPTAIYLNKLSALFQEQNKMLSDSLTERKKELLINKANRDYIQFADTSKLALPALLAILNTNVGLRFKSNEQFYRGFLKRMQKELPNSAYTKQYEELIAKVAYQHSPNQVNNKRSFLWLVIVLAILLVVSLGYNIHLLSKQKQVKEPTNTDYHALLTIKEKQIVMLIDEGLSNKEIAEKLNVELSTVKSHVSNIFQKANITNRNQISKIALALR